MTVPAIRTICVEDNHAVVSIYAQHVLTGTATFEEEPPTAEEIKQRLTSLLEGNFPGLVAEHEGRVVGYAFAGPFKARSAYRYTVEDSIYLEPAFQGRGIGRALLSQLIETCIAQGFRQIMAAIGDSQNTASIALHRSMGFTHIGIARGIGFKFGQALDVVYMQRYLDPGCFRSRHLGPRQTKPYRPNFRPNRATPMVAPAGVPATKDEE